MAKIAVGQLCSTADMAHNLSQCNILISKAAAAGVKALFLPEASDYITGSAAETVSLVRSVEDSKFVIGLRREARTAGVAVTVGLHEPTDDGKKVKNTLVWINDEGNITHRYQKLHLFDVEIQGGPVLKESRSVEKGMKILPPFETSIGRVGLAICFDLRFPEIALALRRQGCQILTYPSAFTVPTGRAHWEVMLRARAIETQSYVVAAAQAGTHNGTRASYGHSMIVSPWGEVLASLDGCSSPDIATAEIDLTQLERIRREMPLDRRTDIYPEV